MSEDNVLLIYFNISNRVFELGIFQADCTTNVIDVLKKIETDMGLGDGFKKVAVSVEINRAEIKVTSVKVIGPSIFDTFLNILEDL